MRRKLGSTGQRPPTLTGRGRENQAVAAAVAAAAASAADHYTPQIEFPSILLPPDISSGSIVDITVGRNLSSESAAEQRFQALQDKIFNAFGAALPLTPVLRCRNATQTSVVLEWDPIQLATADLISLSLYRNNNKAGTIPKPLQMHTTKISGLAVDTTYTFHLVLRTTAGTYTSDKVEVQTHKMTDLSGITITTGILPQATREQLAVAVERIGAKTVDSVRIDTTHFVTTEGRGIQWEKAVEMNIPVVRPEWVEACEKSGRILGVTKFYLDAVRGPQSEDNRPGTASTQLPPNQQQHGVQSPPPAPAPPPKEEKDLPAAPAAENGEESVGGSGSGLGNKENEKPADEEDDAAAAQKKEEGVDGGDKESDDEDDENRPEEKTRSAAEDEQKFRAEDKEQNLTARPKWAATIEDADDDKPAPSPAASRSSFQEVQL